MLVPHECGPNTLANSVPALDQLAEASPTIEKRLIEASAACIAADGQVTVEEAELLRVVSDALGCPMPPLLGPVVASPAEDG